MTSNYSDSTVAFSSVAMPYNGIAVPAVPRPQPQAHTIGFPHERYGLPLSADYGYSQDLALLRATVSSGWVRQRRTYTHAASLVRVSFRLSTQNAMELVQWLHNNPSWMRMTLLSGNDRLQNCDLYEHLVRRTSDIQSSRVAMLNQFVVSFEVETNRLVGSQTSLDIGAGASSNLYPSDLPIPIMEGFSASHGARNVTTYSLLYRMSTNLLKQWNYFAAFKGTAWFMSPMVSPNVPCGREWIRYISNPEVRLIRPNVFEVSIQAESMPSAYSIEGVTAPGGGLPIYPPISGCTYDDSLIKYDENGHPYECGTGGGGGGGGGGGVATPTNDFVVPASRMIVSASMQGTAPVTVTSKISFMRTGAVLLVDSVSPAWTTWYSIAVPDGTLKPLWLTIPSGVEYSLEDGTNTWQTSAGFEYQLNGADLGISLRFAHTTSVSETVMSQVFPYQFLRNDIKGVKEVVANFEIGHQVNAIITTVTPPASPFVANFGMVGSRVRTPWHDEARSSVRITNWNNAGYRGALIADNILTLGDGVTQSVTYWIDPVMSGGAGTYTIQVLNVVGNMSPGAGTYSLPFDFSEVEFSLSALGSGPTNGTIETATADIKIYKNGTLVSEGSISLRSDSRGVIV